MPLDIFNGSMLSVKILTGEYKQPERGHAWMILNGDVNHVTGTSSTQAIYQIDKSTSLWSAIIDTTVNSAHYPFGTYTLITAAPVTYMLNQLGSIIITDQMWVYFAGGSGSYANISVIDFIYK